MSDPDDDEAVLWAPVDEDEDTTSHDGFTSEEYAACLKVFLVVCHDSSDSAAIANPLYPGYSSSSWPSWSIQAPSL
eukprot:m.85419 g.85419  ORF g.85419 m.85419 type:complete len:76 (+) comp14724_c0_seq4:70-297(+)